jgi:hypothetical protein
MSCDGVKVKDYEREIVTLSALIGFSLALSRMKQGFLILMVEELLRPLK